MTRITKHQTLHGHSSHATRGLDFLEAVAPKLGAIGEPGQPLREEDVRLLEKCASAIPSYVEDLSRCYGIMIARASVVPEPVVGSSVASVVDNLRRSVPALAEVAAWRIDAAHREWTTSEEQDDDQKIVGWLPDDDDTGRLAYLRLQRGDLERTIRELERSVSQQHSTIRTLREQLEDKK